MPFTAQQFVDVFASYNESVFPMQIVLLVAALVATRLAGNGDTASSNTVVVVLSFFWLWMGTIYHWLFFSNINTLALVFGGFFIIQAVILFYAGVVRRDLSFRRQSAARSLIGTLFVVYALLIYPIIGMAVGRSYPYSPTFGLPCPTTIFTLGVLVRSGCPVPNYVLLIPIAWSLLGFSAAVYLGIWEDVGLLIAALVGSSLLISFHTRQGYGVHSGLSLKEN